jgi:glycosyltransferase involved in cell wall biosynthesis
MVVHKYYPVGETRVEREALALIDHGHEVDVICLRADDEPPIDNVDGVSIYRLPLKRHGRGGRAGQLLEYLAFFILVFGKLLALHRRRRYGVVQVHNLPDFLIFAALGPKLAGAKLILDLHDLMPEFYASLTGSDMTSWPVRLVVWQEKFSCRFADHVITVTDIWKETLIKRGVPAHKVSVVMNLADARIFHHSPAAELRTKSEDCFNLIYHGTFTHRYGVDLILRAIDKVRRQIPGIHLTLLGGGELRDGLEELLSELNLHDHVYLSQDFIPAVKLPKMIRESDIGIVPNRSDIFTDGLLPTKLMEYVALGTPVIAARTPTIAAYFDETMLQFFRPGDVDDLAECILALHADRSRLTQFVRNSDMFNQKYNWTRVAADYVALVERLNSK